MEKVLIRVKAQGDLQQRNWTSPSGETIVIKGVDLELTDGIDSFVAEATDKLAESLANQPLDKNLVYAVQCKMTIRSWNSQQGQAMHATTIRLISIKAV